MSIDTNVKKTQFSVGNIIYWTIGILLVLTLLSIWLVTGLFAKYVSSAASDNEVRVAGTGGATLELLEHRAYDAEGYADAYGGEYRLDLTDEVRENNYTKVLPGVDIPKDPFVRLKIKNAEVDFELYIQITESEYFPEYVTYSVTDKWECVDAANGIYKYKVYFDAGETYDFTGRNTIPILKSNKLFVSEHYVGEDKQFSLSFKSWLKQVD